MGFGKTKSSGLGFDGVEDLGIGVTENLGRRKTEDLVKQTTYCGMRISLLYGTFEDYEGILEN